MMIISASRRTDIPAFFSDWLIERLREGTVIIRNPWNKNQTKKISLTSSEIGCLVFWTKDPANMLDKLDIIDQMGFKYYFQFTLTGYDNSIEKGSRKKDKIIKTFKTLSNKIGKDRVIWRYDPIILNDYFSIDYHKNKFSELCKELSEYTDLCIISFVDLYPKLKAGIIREITNSEMLEIGSFIYYKAKEYGICVEACSENIDLTSIGIERASCIDKTLVEKICGYQIDIKKDKNQRKGCNCIKSIDIGEYNTCGNSCIYCYANTGRKKRRIM